MSALLAFDEALASWEQLPVTIGKSVQDLSPRDFDLRGGPDNWSIRETVHHLVEANLVAATILLAGHAKPGCTYDWSWLTPSAAWMVRMGYHTADARPGLQILSGLCPYVAGLLRASDTAVDSWIMLLDEPGVELRRVSIEEVLRQEVEHAESHLHEIWDIRERYGK